MTTTPTLFTAKQQANVTDSGAGGDDQQEQQVIGLANGNVVVLWESNTNVFPGDPAGIDIIGRLYDPVGNAIGAEFLVNTVRDTDDEGNFDAAPLPNGGFVVVYEDVDANGTSLVFEVRNATGQNVWFDVIQNDPGTDILGDPSVAVAPDGGFLVVYQQQTGALVRTMSVKVAAVTYAVSAPQQLIVGSNAGFQTDVATLTDGRFVAVSRYGDADNSLTYRFIGADGIPQGSAGFLGDTGANGSSDSAPSVAALPNGGFVVAWANVDFQDPDVFVQVFSSTGVPGSGAQVNSTGTQDNNVTPQVVGLSDGGFLVVYDNNVDSTIKLQRYNASATAVGTEVTVAGSATESLPTVSLSGDGRLLVGWTNATGTDNDVEFAIWDPRDTVINGTSRGELITSRIDGATVNADNGNDTLLGQGAADTLSGGFGNDSILGGGGADLLEGGFDSDTIDGGEGSDRIYAATQASPTSSGVGDSLAGAGGDDTIVGSDGNDTIDGGFGFDSLDGGNGTDTNDATFWSGGYLWNMTTGVVMFATSGGSESAVNFENALTGDGNDVIAGTSAANSISTRGGQDSVEGGGGADTIDGGEGNDTLLGGDGRDSIQGGGGNDLIRVLEGELADDVDGGPGFDTFDLSARTSLGSFIDLGTSFHTTGYVGYALTNIETVFGSQADDTLNGDGAANTLFGNGGDDSIDGRDGNDVLLGGGGADTMGGGPGADTLVGGPAPAGRYNQLDGGTEIDTVSYGGFGMGVYVTLAGGAATVAATGALVDTLANIENVVGSASNDTIVGDAAANILNGGGGTDLVYGGGGDDVLIGGTSATGTQNQLYGEGGIDTVVYALETADVYVELRAPAGYVKSAGAFVLKDFINTVENAVGGSGNDILVGTDADFNVLVGNAGTDLLFGFGGDDILNGGSALPGQYNQLFGDAGSDTASYAGAAGPVYAELTIFAGYVNSGSGLVLTDVWNSIENLQGSSFADVLAGDAAANVIAGGGGADILYGRGGSDTFVYNAPSESPLSAYDTIADFQTGVDKLELRDFGINATVTIQSGGGATALYADTDPNTAGYEFAVSFVGANAIALSDIIFFDIVF